MTLWLTRAGSSGEYESRFLSEGRIYLTWHELTNNLEKLKTRQELHDLLVATYPEDKPARLRNWASQIWPFVKRMKVGDWVVLPSKQKASIHVGEITGEYTYNPDGPAPYYHYRTVNWFATDIPRSNFDQDILYSFGAFMTICRISRNDAKNRVKAMAQNNWKSTVTTTLPDTPDTSDAEVSGFYDIERIARDQIAKFLERKFKGHAMSRLIEAILQAQGYVTYRSPEGPDKGVDLLAATGALGFGSPKLSLLKKGH